MGAKNKVIAGEYEGKNVMLIHGAVCIMTGFTKKVELTKENVEEYELLDETNNKSAVSAVSRGLVGSFLLGPVGLLAGLSAKTKGVHVVAIKFKDGKKSLLEVNEKIYAALMKNLF
ncbi:MULTISPECIES: hypothetical protein [Geobacillus]|uniref:Hypothetical conserved protein n=1 Tax=Geobacillus kaustophilus (strain HTA426) TaxID=235909 RepID=Q5L2J5_GEOKA|nr:MULTISPECIES: hypothetical protein [Geobacillus]MBW7642403.1 hypothetical protein [Geobacillus thermoleovorans]MCK7604873.1 hypothetical protein [Geobacillus stearothermophilus]BAD74835.1 hypothetical conserved protein [Geobacillus kaustophilus HTA426]